MRISIALLVVALLGASASPAHGRPGAVNPKSWTVILYFAGDAPNAGHPIDALMMDRVNGLVGSSKAWGANVANVIALVDRGGADAATYQIRSGALEQLTRPKAAADLGDPHTLDVLLDLVIARFPAQHYALAIKGHGTPAGELCADKVVGDPNSSDGLSMRELSDSLARFEARAEGRLELLVLDACMAATVEGLSVVAPHVDEIVASPDLLFARSLPYHALLNRIDAGASTGAEVAAAVVGAYPEDAPPGMRFGVLASFSGAKLLAVRGAFDDLADALLANGDAATRAPAIRAAARRTFAHEDAAFIDPAGLARRIEALHLSSEIDTAARAAFQAAQAATGAPEAITSGDDMADSCGLSIHSPAVSSRYRPSDPWSKGSWARLIDAVTKPSLDAGIEARPVPPVTRLVPKGPGLEAITSSPDPKVVRFEFVVMAAGAKRPILRIPTTTASSAAGASIGELRDQWDFGRFVLAGSSDALGRARVVECPIERVRELQPTSDHRRRLLATTACVSVSRRGERSRDTQLRLYVEQKTPSPQSVWSARIACAFELPDGLGCNAASPFDPRTHPIDADRVHLNDALIRVRPPEPISHDLMRVAPKREVEELVLRNSQAPEALRYERFPSKQGIRVGHVGYDENGVEVFTSVIEVHAPTPGNFVPLQPGGMSTSDGIK